jgi:hypothetical protein
MDVSWPGVLLILAPGFWFGGGVVKRNFLISLVSYLALIAAGCAPQVSLFGLFRAEDKEFDQRVLGEWKMQSGAESNVDQGRGRIVFRHSSEGPAYEVTVLDFDTRGLTLVCTGRLTRLGSQLFIDFSTPDPGKRKFAEFPYPTVQSHIFGKIQVEKNSMRIDFLSDDWIKKLASAGKLPLATVEAEEGLVLSDQTEELRNFMREHAADSKAFSESFSLRREQ